MYLLAEYRTIFGTELGRKYNCQVYLKLNLKQCMTLYNRLYILCVLEQKLLNSKDQLHFFFSYLFIFEFIAFLFDNSLNADLL